MDEILKCDSKYMKNHVPTFELRNKDLITWARSSKLSIRNLKSCRRKAEKTIKYIRLERDSNPWTLPSQSSALPTELHICSGASRKFWCGTVSFVSATTLLTSGSCWGSSTSTPITSGLSCGAESLSSVSFSSIGGRCWWYLSRAISYNLLASIGPACSTSWEKIPRRFPSNI